MNLFILWISIQFSNDLLAIFIRALMQEEQNEFIFYLLHHPDKVRGNKFVFRLQQCLWYVCVICCPECVTSKAEMKPTHLEDDTSEFACLV